MNLLLLWLAVPLAFSPLVSRTAPAGVARLLTGGVALAFLWQGMGTLDPTDLVALGRLSPDDARFIALSAGFGIGALLVVPRDRWAAVLPAIPLAIGLAMSLVPAALAFAVLGAGIATIPRGVAAIAGHRLVGGTPGGDEPSHDVRFLVAPALATLAIAAQGPFLLSAVAAAATTWWSRSAGGSSTPSRLSLLRPAAVFLLLALATWLVLTAAGEMLVLVRGAEQAVPASPALARLVAALILGAALVMVAPAPRQGSARHASVAPAAVLLAATAAQVVPDGVVHWAPLAAATVVALAALAMLRRLPLAALAPVVVLGAIIPGRGWPLAAFLLAWYPVVVAVGGAATSPRGEHATAMARVVAGGAGIALAFVLRGVLADEVVWALVLGVLCITAACVAARDPGSVA
ncbi:MAG: hypothetical protein H0W15_07565 [Gemmatimonadales bacterium]|nr:hypothetical protein [Gemmatimonadales bacterium]